jgi:cation diffusion facilitator family transporter
VLWWVLALNLAVALAKLGYGLWSQALSITADGIHSLVDSAANVVGLIGIVVARRPPDANHPYGHRKYETFAALGIAVLMFFGCWQIGATAVDRMFHPVAPRVTFAGYAVLIVTLLINAAVVWVERREAVRLKSELLASDATHTASDAVASLLVLASFVALRFGFAWADAVAATMIIVLVVRAGLAIVRGTLSTLSDERRLPPQMVEAVALREPGVLEAHNVRSRGPEDDIHLDLHILVDPRTPLSDAHALGHRVEQRLRAEWPGLNDVVVHVEPGLESERAREREGGGLKAPG